MSYIPKRYSYDTLVLVGLCSFVGGAATIALFFSIIVHLIGNGACQ